MLKKVGPLFTSSWKVIFDETLSHAFLILAKVSQRLFGMSQQFKMNENTHNTSFP